MNQRRNMARGCVVLFAMAAMAVPLACGSGEQEGAQDPSSQAYGQQTYGQPTSTQPTYTPPTYGNGYSQPTTTATATATPAATGVGQLGAFPCQSDATCVTHRCNTATGTCAFPCQTADDCQTGYQCISPLCVPAGFTPTQ
jgi:hypothetical protein